MTWIKFESEQGIRDIFLSHPGVEFDQRERGGGGRGGWQLGIFSSANRSRVTSISSRYDHITARCAPGCFFSPFSRRRITSAMRSANHICALVPEDDDSDESRSGVRLVAISIRTFFRLPGFSLFLRLTVSSTHARSCSARNRSTRYLVNLTGQLGSSIQDVCRFCGRPMRLLIKISLPLATLSHARTRIRYRRVRYSRFALSRTACDRRSLLREIKIAPFARHSF